MCLLGTHDTVRYKSSSLWSQCLKHRSVNSLASGKCTCGIKCLIIKRQLLIEILNIAGGIVISLMPQDCLDGKSILVQVMTWCRQATNPCLNQCWPRFIPSYGVTQNEWTQWSRVTHIFVSNVIYLSVYVSLIISHVRLCRGLVELHLIDITNIVARICLFDAWYLYRSSNMIILYFTIS